MTQVATTVTPMTDDEVIRLLGTGPGSIMVPNEDHSKNPPVKNNFFGAPGAVDTAFLDTPGKPGNDNEEGEEPAGAGNPPPAGAPTAATPPAGDPAEGAPDLSFLNPANEGDEPGAAAAAAELGAEDAIPGKTSSIVQLTKKFMDKKLLVPFEGEEDITKYKLSDYEELWEMNIQKLQQDNLAKVEEEFISQLPEEFHHIYAYVAHGGTDLKPLLKALTASEEIKAIDITNEYGQEQVVRAYLQAKQFGTAPQIEEEINAYKDRGELAKKAGQFQPSLKAMQDSVIQQRVAYQQQIQKVREEESRKYAQNLHSIISKGDLNGVPLDPKTKDVLYNGLTQAVYPSQAGGHTNLLGHLLEQNQWVTPNHGLIAEVLWLLQDREGYHAKVKEIAKRATEEKVMRTLKNAEADKKGASSTETDEPGAGRSQKPSVQRKRNIFER